MSNTAIGRVWLWAMLGQREKKKKVPLESESCARFQRISSPWERGLYSFSSGMERAVLRQESLHLCIIPLSLILQLKSGGDLAGHVDTIWPKVTVAFIDGRSAYKLICTRTQSAGCTNNQAGRKQHQHKLASVCTVSMEFLLHFNKHINLSVMHCTCPQTVYEQRLHGESQTGGADPNGLQWHRRNTICFWKTNVKVEFIFAILPPSTY